MRSESILQVAIQCPYSGGVAVSSARAFIHLLNDTLVYDDESICGAMGIFRMQNTKEEIEAASLAVFPNPSSGVFQFVFSSLIGDQFNCEINNLLGQNVFSKQILTKSNTFQLDLTLLNNGIYSIRIIDKNRSQLTEKIIISK